MTSEQKKQRRKEVIARFYQAHREEIREYQNGRKLEKKEYDKKYRELNLTVIEEKRKQYRYEHASEKADYDKQYRKENRIFLNAKRVEKVQKDILIKIKVRLRSRLVGAICKNQKKGSAIRDLGCSVEELKIYLESLFQPGMTWENWSRTGWHIDHKKPLSAFDLTDPEQFRQAVHYTNLQPLWALENIRKSNK